MKLRNYTPLAVLGLLYLITRLWGIRSLPMFIDEVIYARWAQMGFFDPAARLVSLGDGKPPFFIWVTSMMMEFVRNPVMAGRLVSIACGMVTMAGLYLISTQLFKSRKVGAVSMLLYILFPLALLLNRFGLMDSMVGMFAVWSVYLEILFVRTLSLSVMFALALVVSGGILTKTSGYIPLYLLPLSLLLFDWQIQKRSVNFVRWVMLSVGTVSLTYLYTSVLYLSREADFISKKNELFLYPIGELVSRGIWNVAVGNFITLTGWSMTYLTVPFLIALLYGTIRMKSHIREVLFLWLWVFIPYTGMAVISRSMATRYVLPVLLPIIPVAGYIFHTEVLKKRRAPLFALLSVLTVLVMSYTDVIILTDLSRAPIAREDLFQYANGWPSGGGMKEIIAYFVHESEQQKIMVISEGAYGSLPATAMDIYFMQNPNVERLGLVTVTGPIPDDILQKAISQPVYLITNQMQSAPDWPVEMISQFRKGIGQSYIRVYRVTQ